MKLIRRLKQAILTRILRRPAVLDNAIIKAIEDPAALNRALKNNALRAKLVKEISQEKDIVSEMIQHPDVIKMITRDPMFFEAMLRRSADHPEVILRVFSYPTVSKRLVAQKAFLQNIARNPKLMARIISHVPHESLHTIAAALFKPIDPDIEADNNIDTDFALTLLAAIDPKSKQAGDILTDILQEHRQDNLPSLIANIATRDSDVIVDLLSQSNLRESVIAALEPDTQTLLNLLRDYVLLSKDAPTVALRIENVFEKIMTEKVIVKALSENLSLRNALLARLDDTFSGTGDSLEDNLPKARSNLADLSNHKKASENDAKV
jgi:DNA-directed RNA polymerase subunit L